MKNDPDAILARWAAARSATPEHLDTLTRRITNEARRRRLESVVGAYERQPVSLWGKLAYSGLGAAVTAAVFLLVLGWPNLSPKAVRDPDHGVDLAGISIMQLAANRQLFGEMQRLFSDGLRWVAQSDGDVGIGVEDAPRQNSSAKAVPMLVKVTVLSRKSGEQGWHQAWSADMLVHGQDLVEVVLDRRSDNKLTLWVYPLDDGKLAVDTSVSLQLPVPLVSRINAVVARGQPAEIATLHSGDTEYRVFQTVEFVNPNRT